MQSGIARAMVGLIHDRASFQQKFRSRGVISPGGLLERSAHKTLAIDVRSRVQQQFRQLIVSSKAAHISGLRAPPKMNPA